MADLDLGNAVFNFRIKEYEKEKQRAQKEAKDLADKMSKQFEQRFKGIGKAFIWVGAGMAAVGAASLTFFKNSIKLAWEQGRAEEKVFSVLQATQNQVGRTFDELKKQASDLQGISVFGDEDILENLTAPLLTFKSIQGEVFDRTQELALDLSATFGTDLKWSAIQLGKAIEDPIKGMSALSRVWVTFSAEQEKQIRNYVEQWELVKAQSVILDTLEGQVWGVAEGMAMSFDGQTAQINNARWDLREGIWEAFTNNEEFRGFFVKILSTIQKVTEYIKANPELVITRAKVAAWLVAVGTGLVVLGTLFVNITRIISAVKAVSTAFTFLAANPIFLVVWALAAAAFLIYKNWDTIAPLFQRVSAAISTAMDRVTVKIQSVVSRFSNLRDRAAGAFESLAARLWVSTWVLRAVLTIPLGPIWFLMANFRLLRDVAVQVGSAISAKRSSVTASISSFAGRIRGAIQWVIGIFNSLRSRVTAVINSVKARVESFSLWNLVSLLPGRATWGPVSWWSAYVVWEKGPEVFVPKNSGFVLPNDISKSIVNNNTNNINVWVNDNSSDPFGFGRDIGLGIRTLWL